MDETQRRKLTAKEFIQKNRAIGFIVLAIFIILFIIYFSFIYFYSKPETTNNLNTATTTAEDSGFFGNLLPTFLESNYGDEISDNDPLLGSFSNRVGNNLDVDEDNTQENDTTKLTKIESKPVMNYVAFLKPISIKTYIKDKPKLCDAQLAVVTKKDTKSIAVTNFQNMLRSVDGYEDTPDSGVLDNNTAEKLYLYQLKYAQFLYKNKTDKTPTRVIDKETTHFLNLMCGFEKENADDYIQVPTLRYVTKADRQIYDYNTDTKEKTQTQIKVSTSTGESIFSQKGDYVVFRSDTGGQIESEFFTVRTKNTVRLEKNITTLDFNDKDLLVYGVPGTDGIIIKLYDQNKNSLRVLAQIPLNEWTIFWANSNEIGIYSKPSASADGIYMLLNINTKKLRQLAGPLKGMEVQKTSTSDYSILSTAGIGQVKSYLLNNTSRTIGDLGINTFASKCSQTVFANAIFCAVPRSLDQNATYPDDWYKGKTRFSDVIMYKSTNSTSSRVISYLEGKDLSIINMQINKNGIFFMDENNFGLYQLEP